MSASARLRARDVRAVYLLTNECRDLGDDSAAWRGRLLAGLGRLVDAELGFSGEMAGLRAGRPNGLGVAEWGWDHGFERAGWLHSVEMLRTDPNFALLFGAYARRGGEALRRSELVDDRTWRRSAEYDEVYRVVGIDHPIFCFPPVPGAADEVSGGILGRAAGRPDFTARETAIVGEAFAAVGALVGGPLARFADPSPSALPPRCRQVLVCLLAGDGDKQVARRLRISPHTVNQYVKTVLAHFGCQSRAELLARWVRRGWCKGFTWADPDDGSGRNPDRPAY